jgi:hypothetical protein
MEGRPLLSSRTINGGMAISRERNGREEEKSSGAHLGGGGTAGGRHGGCGLLLRPPVLYFHLLFCCYVSSVREVENSRKEEGERRKQNFQT